MPRLRAAAVRSTDFGTRQLLDDAATVLARYEAGSDCVL